MSEKAEQLCKSMRKTHYPHQLHKDIYGVVWETISYPWVSGRDRVVINVRVPGDPTTLRIAECFDLDPEGANCLCASGGEFYFRDPERYATLRHLLPIRSA